MSAPSKSTPVPASAATTGPAPARFELVVHIGTGKTGSSSIQKTLSANKPLLRRHHTAYLGLMMEEAPIRLFNWQKAGAWPEWVALGQPKGPQQLREVLLGSLDRLVAQGFGRAIWSNETIFGNDRLVLPLLREIQSSGIGVRIIVYVRRHDAWARSAYLQWGIKHKTYPGPLRSFREWRTKHKANFYHGLKPWLDGPWQDVAVRNFDACGDVVADFLKQYGLHEPEIAVKRENETPHAVAMALWALYNGQVDEPVLPAVLQRALNQAGLLERAPRDVDFAALLPTAQDIEAVRADASEDRERLNQLFRASGQPDMEVAELAMKPLNVTQNQINAALLMLIKQQSDQINRLRRLIENETKQAG